MEVYEPIRRLSFDFNTQHSHTSPFGVMYVADMYLLVYVVIHRHLCWLQQLIVVHNRKNRQVSNMSSSIKQTSFHQSQNMSLL